MKHNSKIVAGLLLATMLGTTGCSETKLPVTVTETETPKPTPIDQATLDKLKSKIMDEAESVDFDSLARNGDFYKGKYLKLVGQIIQAQYEDDNTILRVNITHKNSGWDNTIMVFMPKENECIDTKVLEDDTITLYGIGCGDYTYTSVLGADITLPLVTAYVVELGWR